METDNGKIFPKKKRPQSGVSEYFRPIMFTLKHLRKKQFLICELCRCIIFFCTVFFTHPSCCTALNIRYVMSPK